jgi:hypothetical protein
VIRQREGKQQLTTADAKAAPDLGHHSNAHADAIMERRAISLPGM